MRIRPLLTAIGLLAAAVSPASAGTGSSTWCNDGAAYREVPVLTSPMTVGVEVVHAPGGPSQFIRICYSTTAVGQPGVVTGGQIALDVQVNTGTISPGAYVGVGCYPDFVSGAGPVCAFANSANVATGDLPERPTQTSTCLVAVLGSCVAYVPGVRVAAGGDAGRPLLAIQVVGLPLHADLPRQCIPVTVPC